MLAAASLEKTAADTPILLGRPSKVILASSRLNATPETICFSTISSSSHTMVPWSMFSPGSTKLDSTRTGTRWAMASSTERVCNTLAPRDAISSISSNEIFLRRLALASMRGSVV